MKRLLKITCTFLMLLIVLSFTAINVYANNVITTTTNGWLTDLDGNLLTDSDGYYVLTLKPESVVGGEVTANLNKFASLFLNDFRNISSARYTKKLKIVNETGKNISYKDYSFTTENDLPRTDNIFSVTQGKLTNSMDRAFGSAYTAMLSTITSPSYRTDLCLDVKGFDGKNINIMMANLRSVNDAVVDFYGLDSNNDVSLPQMINLEANLRAAGYESYAAYLKSYYGVSDLRQIPLGDAYNVLGTTRGAQTGITNWRDNTIEGKPIPAAEVAQLDNYFKIWGIAGVNADPKDKDLYPLIPNYFIMETDPEVLAFAHEYLYTHGLRFSLDEQSYPYDSTDSEKGKGGIYGIKSYIDKDRDNQAYVEDLLGEALMQPGETLTLDHVSAGLYVPNAWNQHRLYDFGFSLLFSVNPRSTDVPETGENWSLQAFWGLVLILTTLGLIIGRYIYRKKN